MKLQIVSFTKQGAALSLKCKQKVEESVAWQVDLVSAGQNHAIDIPRLTGSLQDWVKQGFEEKRGIIFIGAAGIAVRSIAPFLQDKTQDPPVLVLDEKGEYVIPILSGHLGGANAIAVFLAEICGGKAVLTTASDVHHLLAPDVFANQNNLYITDIKKSKKVAAKLVAEEQITMVYCPEAVEINGRTPDEIVLQEEPDFFSGHEVDVRISPFKGDDTALWLVPKCMYLGMGCRKGKSHEELLKFVREVLETEHIAEKSICGVFSIDLKKEELGLIQLAKTLDVPFLTFTAGQLQAQTGEFTASEFVQQKVGIDNVCERAVMAAGAAYIWHRKITKDGMTLAIGIKKGTLSFE